MAAWRRPARRALRAGLAALAATAVLLLLVLWWAPGAAFRLVVVRGVPGCDLMLVPGGGARERVATAAELLHDGACGRIMITGQALEGEAAQAGGLWAGLDPARVVRAPFRTESTWDDAIAALTAARQHGFRSLLVVTSPFHTRRLELLFERVFDGTGVRFGVYPSESWYFDYRTWWRSPYGRRVVIGEYLKLWATGLAGTAVAGLATASALPWGGW